MPGELEYMLHDPRRGGDFTWGRTIAAHKVGPYAIVEYYSKITDKYQNGQLVRRMGYERRPSFHPFVNGEDTSHSFKDLDEALAAAEGITGYRLIQREAGVYDLAYTAVAEAYRNLGSRLSGVLSAVYGRAARISVRQHSVIPVEQSGKFRLAHALPAAR